MTDRQTDGQTDSPNALSRLRYSERRLKNWRPRKNWPPYAAA